MVVRFEDDRLTGDGGALLLREADRRIGLLRRVVDYFTDGREPAWIEHELRHMLTQRI